MLLIGNGKENIMKLKKTLAGVMTLSTILFSTSASAMTMKVDNFLPEEPTYLEQNETIITINGKGYNAQEYMDRVLDYTIASNPIDAMETDDGSEIEFEYNDSRQRTEKIIGEERITYDYDEFSNLKSEVLPDKKQITYSYEYTDNANNADSISYCNNTYHYMIEDGIITGLLDSNNQTICTYTYDENGATKHIYEIRGKKKIEHWDNSSDDFVGCVNSIRYDGKCYDSETDMFYLNTGSYYDTKADELVGDKCYVDMEGLFGDQYETLSNQESQSSTDDEMNKASLFSIPSPLQSELIYAATKRYEDALGTDGDSLLSEGSTWYTKYSSSDMHFKLAARIIYGENTNKGSGSSEIQYLKYNRQGIAWVITNRLLEDKYRKSHSQATCFSSSSTPSLYSVLTYSGAFASLGSRNAKGAMDSNSIAYQQALLLACYISVCSNFDEYDAVVPRPTGVTYQCYNKGALTSSSSPVSTWSNVRFPGDSTNYTGKSNYTAFPFYSAIGKFNVLHSYSSESLKIQSAYY